MAWNHYKSGLNYLGPEPNFQLVQKLTFKGVKLVQNLTSLHIIYIYIYIYVGVYFYMLLCSISGVFSRVQRCSPFFASWCNHFQTQKSCCHPVKPSFLTQLSLEMTNWSLSSNAFKNGALMLHNIGTPLLIAYRHPTQLFPMFRALSALSWKPRNPYFCRVLVPRYPFRHDPPNTCRRIFPSQKNISGRMENVNSRGSLVLKKNLKPLSL